MVDVDREVTVVGAGLAGVEAAWQAARMGCRVRLYEMRPGKMTPAHRTGGFAELVCSNSLRSSQLENAAGLLKEEMRRLGSLIMEVAERTAVPAGKALAVDREAFSGQVTEHLEGEDGIEIVRREVCELPEEPAVIATGPLTSEALAERLVEVTGEDALHFFDAAAPILTRESLNMEVIFPGSRYDPESQDYLNCPLNREQYEEFWHELVHAQQQPLHGFEDQKLFEGCLPVEELGRRGKKTLLFGPLKPVGLEDPRTQKRPHAVVQLRQDNLEGSLYNMVGFQTRLTWGEQKRVFRLIPGLERAEFVRLGVMHRNTFLNSPRLLLPTLQLEDRPHLFFAGQITGVEGYVESAACGLVAGLNVARQARGMDPMVFPPETAHGALLRYITTPDENFQPSNINFGLLPRPHIKVRDKRERRRHQSERALEVLDDFKRRAFKFRS